MLRFWTRSLIYTPTFNRWPVLAELMRLRVGGGNLSAFPALPDSCLLLAMAVMSIRPSDLCGRFCQAASAYSIFAGTARAFTPKFYTDWWNGKHKSRQGFPTLWRVFAVEDSSAQRKQRQGRQGSSLYLSRPSSGPPISTVRERSRPPVLFACSTPRMDNSSIMASNHSPYRVPALSKYHATWRYVKSLG